MESNFVHELFVEVGLVKTRLYRGVHIAYADRSALDSFYDILDDKVEVMSEEEKIIRNTTILTDAAFETSRETLEELKASTTDDVSFQEIVLEEILASLRQRGISEEEKNRLHGEMEEVKANIRNMKMEVKNKANDVKQKKASLHCSKKKIQRI